MSPQKTDRCLIALGDMLLDFSHHVLQILGQLTIVLQVLISGAKKHKTQRASHVVMYNSDLTFFILVKWPLQPK